ncbi:MAG: radical SAM protein [Elusimicrobia bacterium]|nr:radical SAM protein [Elusimicrobiota bacterium]
MSEKVLIVTGSLVSQRESSAWHALRKLALQWRGSQAPWLDLKVKALVAEPALSAALERRRLGSGSADAAVRRYFSVGAPAALPELTEVVLATALRDLGMPHECATYEELFARPRLRERLLSETTCVFASTTLLHDLSEVEPIVALLKRPHNRVVLGGALTGVLARDWDGAPGLDALAVGYGELLARPLVDWMRGGYHEIEPGPGGRLEKRGLLQVLFSGTPNSRDLDFLPTPDWSLARGGCPALVSYESVRGCPYRCAFCNYPYLFDDTQFRFKSARRIADDWQGYAERLGVTHVSCLDSLFTMPRPRLRELCRLLIERGVPVRWICYARADDLADDSLIAMMREAGCVQVHVGVESGDQTMLDNMNKDCSVESNRKALLNCRKFGVASLATVVVGFPGETPQSLEATYDLLAAAPPDFHFTATFSTRVADVPVLSAQSRARFGLKAMGGLRSVAPYWSHDSMDCAEAAAKARELDRRLAVDKISLNAAAFYPGILGYEPALREPLLDFQRRSLSRPVGRGAFDMLHRFIDARLRRDLAAWLAQEENRERAVLSDPVAA